ncbi:hypothetical protein MAPG_04874 [Magnaporthiopsis poae ATCC 64411]|uniref:Uncharacterized protein n=1 Tax=Magnaporthiopsis poae (strain ATCC 64411 / 73-15) TaxID=644358 RepID=A0A0C4DXW7_MAGP6|nr:hypothetical protein MAPG_04874 [Magnaporthiopsis poae ATCC 64411]
MEEHKDETDKIEGELVQCSVTEFLVRLAGFLASDDKIDLFINVDSECAATKDGLRLLVELERCLAAILDGAALPITQLSVTTIGRSPVELSICNADEYVECVSIGESNEIFRAGLQELIKSTPMLPQCEDVTGRIPELATMMMNVAMNRFSGCHILSFLPHHVTKALQEHVSGLARERGNERLAFKHLELTGKPWNAESEVEHINTIWAGQGGNWIVSINPEEFPVCLPVSPSLDGIIFWTGSSNHQQRVRVHPMDGRLQATAYEASPFALAWKYKLGDQPNAVNDHAFMACVEVKGPPFLFHQHDAVPSLHKHIHWAAYFMSLPGLAGGVGLSKTWRVQNNATRRNLATALEWVANMGAICRSETGARASSKALWTLEEALLKANIDRDYPLQAAAMWAASGRLNVVQRRVLIRMGAILAVGFPKGESTLEEGLQAAQDVSALRALFTGFAKSGSKTGYLWVMLGLWEHFKDTGDSFNSNLQIEINGMMVVVDRAWGQDVQRYVVALESHYNMEPVGPRSGWMDGSLPKELLYTVYRVIVQCLAQNTVAYRVSRKHQAIMLFKEHLVSEAEPSFIDHRRDLAGFSVDGDMFAAVPAELLMDGESRRSKARFMTLVPVRLVGDLRL